MNTTETKPILCGTDFSENATRAATAAAALSARLRLPLLLAHAGGLPLDNLTQEFYDAQRTAMRARLH